MAKVIIFGVSDLAELAHFYLTNDSEHEVVAFTVHEKYLPNEGTFKSLPVVSFEKIHFQFDPSQYFFLAPLVPKKMNILRKEIYDQIKSVGYRFVNYISSQATVLSNRIGENCFILEDNTIQPFTNIGNNVVLWSGNHIGHHSTIRDHIFITSHVVISGHCTIDNYCYLGVNSTLRDGITLAEGTFIAMGASITKSTKPWSVHKGNPSTESTISSKDLRF